MTRPSDRTEYWNDPAVVDDVRGGSSGVSGFAKLVETRFPRRSRVVELGCGAGDDAAYFAEKGHLVTALDVSEPLISMASQRFANLDDLQFRVADITRPLDVGGDTTDAVYSRLSLGYFDDETTARIFAEVFWILRSGGQFHFLCKSVEDPLYGKGTETGPDIYELDGQVRHFFSREYTLDVMDDTGFVDVRITEGTDKFYGEPSAYILCSGVKR